MKPFVLFSIISLCALTVSAGSASGNDIKSKVSHTFGAEYKGRVSVQKLRDKHSKYLNCIVKLQFDSAWFMPQMESSTICAATGGSLEFIKYDINNQDEKEWADDCVRHGSGSLYVLVVDGKFTSRALGTKRKKDGSGYSYSW